MDPFKPVPGSTSNFVTGFWFRFPVPTTFDPWTMDHAVPVLTRATGWSSHDFYFDMDAVSNSSPDDDFDMSKVFPCQIRRSHPFGNKSSISPLQRHSNDEFVIF